MAGQLLLQMESGNGDQDVIGGPRTDGAGPSGLDRGQIGLFPPVLAL